MNGSPGPTGPTGPPGTSGTSGGGGGSIAILDEGGTIVGTASAINFIGTCVAVTDAGAGQADVTLGQKWVIASHSFAYPESANNSNDYWVGDSKCGWDSCTYDVIYNVKGGVNPNLATAYVNCGIPSPYYIYPNDIVELCGIAYAADATGANNNNFNTTLSYFSCTELSAGEFTGVNLQTSSQPFDFENSTFTACFNLTWTADRILEPCTTLFLLGFQVNNLLVQTDVKVSYTFKVTRGCTS